MTIELKPIVLIGCSRQFNNKAMFESKTKKILSHLHEYEVVAVEESDGLVNKLFGSQVIETVPYNSKASVINRVINESEYIIIFWDGADIDEFVYRSLLFKKKIRIVAVETTKVANKDKSEPFDVYIGRGTPWGNPFPISDKGMNREQVIQKYEQYFKKTFLDNEEKRRELMSLKGKVLGCHCKPLACHGDVIARYLNSLDEESHDL
jgi:hypothetical protein